LHAVITDLQVTADAHIRAIIVVSLEPLRGEVLRLLDVFNDVLVQVLFVGEATSVSDKCCFHRESVRIEGLF
jgi:hypothetical protein